MAARQKLPIHEHKRPPKRYLLYPGYIGDHFISAAELARCYNVRLADCIVVDHQMERALVGRDLRRMIRLYPRPDGRYLAHLAEIEEEMYARIPDD